MDLFRINRTRTILPPIKQFGSTTSRPADWKLVALAALVAVLLLVSGGCGGGSSSTTTSDTVTIAVYPTTLTLPISTSQQFTATVAGSTNTNVTWQVNGTTGGSATYGTISTSGLYTAPGTVPSTAITVTAIAQADTSKTATATVTATNANKLTIDPTQPTLSAGGQQTFTATLGSNAIDAAWSVSCSSTNTGGCGTISANGIYTAPLAPPPGQTVSVTASTKNNSATAASTTVFVTFGTGSLYGAYAFELTGSSAGVPYRSAGSMQFDGKGNITGGIEDRSGVAVPVNITGGAYVIDAAGQVTATLHTDNGDENWQMTLVNHNKSLVMRTDSVVARGELTLQDTSQFGHSLTGNYTFHLAGSSSGAVDAAGVVGALTFDSQGSVTSGVLDSNDGGSVSANQTVSGTSVASVAGTGRGTVSLTSSLGTQTFAYYLVSSTAANLVEIDGVHDYIGKLGWRTSSTSIDTSAFSGNYAFVFTGANANGTAGQGGTFLLDRTGNISNGIFDISTDTGYALGFLLSGTLAVTDPATGRSLVSFNAGSTALQYVVYPPSPEGVAFLEIDGQNVTTGVAQSTIYSGGSTPSLSGQFALSAGESTTAVRRTVSAGLSMASTPAGTLNLDESGNVTLGTALQGSSFAVTSLYGQGQMQLQGGSYKGTYRVYMVDTGNVLLMEADGKGVLSGVAGKQY